jgi:hypothetical protein
MKVEIKPGAKEMILFLISITSVTESYDATLSMTEKLAVTRRTCTRLASSSRDVDTNEIKKATCFKFFF